MNNKENNDILDNKGSDEASARAEKIKAIRESLRKTEDAAQAQTENAAEANAAAMGIQPQETVKVAAENSQPVGEQLPKLKPLKKAAAAETAQPIAEIPNAEMPKKKKKGKKKKKKKPLKRRIRELFPEKGDSTAEIIRKIVFLISIIAIIVCGYMVADYYLDLWRSRMQNNSISEIYEVYEPVDEDTTPEEPVGDGEKPEKVYKMLNGAKKLLAINPDTVGYLRVLSKDGSDPIIDLPVVQYYDNSKYLDRNFNGEESRTGSLFMDFRNHFDEVEDGKLKYENSDNIIIYGHNMADESMFGKLKYYYGSEQYYMDHPVIQLNSNYETYKYKIFAVFIVDVEDKTETQYECWNCTELNSEEEFYDFVNNAKRRTIYTNDVDVKYGDGLLTLSTCHYLLKDRSRLIIMARTVRPGEDEYKGTEKSERNSNIQWPSMYYNTKRNEKYDKDAIFIPYGPEEAVKEAEAKLAAQKKKEQEAKKKEEQASKDAEKAKNTTTTKKSGSKTTTKSNKTTAKTTKTTAKTTKTTAAKTAS